MDINFGALELVVKGRISMKKRVAVYTKVHISTTMAQALHSESRPPACEHDQLMVNTRAWYETPGRGK